MSLRSASVIVLFAIAATYGAAGLVQAQTSGGGSSGSPSTGGIGGSGLSSPGGAGPLTGVPTAPTVPTSPRVGTQGVGAGAGRSMGSRGPQVPGPAQITPAPQGRTGFGSGSGAPIRGGATASDGPDVSGVRGQVEPLEQRSGWTLAECMETWDAETHMTRRQWRTICQRLVGHGVAANKD